MAKGRKTAAVSTNELVAESERREIRPFQDADEMDTAAVWHRSGLAAYPYLPTWQALTLENARWIFSPRYSSRVRYLGWQIGRPSSCLSRHERIAPQSTVC